MKRFSILLMLLAGCSGQSEKDPIIIEFVKTLRAFPEAGYMSWESGVSPAIPIESKNELNIIEEIITSFSEYESVGPLTLIGNNEADPLEPIYGIQMEKRMKEGSLIQRSILLISRISAGDESFLAYRIYDEEKINSIKIMVAKGLASKR